MLSYENLYDRFNLLVSDDSTEAVALGKLLINETLKYVWGSGDYSFKEKTSEIVSEASISSYELPADVERVKIVYYQVGDILYIPTEISDEVAWTTLIRTTTTTSDHPRYVFYRGDNIEFAPAFTTADLTITVVYEKKIKDLSADDHTDGKVSDLANAGTEVTGSGTPAWTATMVGRYLKVDSDGMWYEIASRTGAAAITLVKPYMGTTISSGSEDYTIAEIPPIPEEYQDLLWLRPTAIYYQVKNEETRSNFYMAEFLRLKEELKRKYRSKTSRQILRGRGLEYRSVNDFPTGITDA